MKVSKAQAAQNRQDILEAAARLYREHGLAGVGVAEVTRGAGLTHGGLYRHFESKDALVREACARAFELPKAVLQRADAVATLATLVGALVLARATAPADAALSDEILATVRTHLTAPRPKRPRGSAIK